MTSGQMHSDKHIHVLRDDTARIGFLFESSSDDSGFGGFVHDRVT
jgi:hypothetical protein